MKYNEMLDKVVDDGKGFKFIKDTTIMVVDSEGCCITCKEPTIFIETCSEAYSCSEECMNVFYQLVDTLSMTDEDR